MSHVGQTRVAVADRHGLFAECLVLVLQARGYLGRRVPLPRTGRPESLISHLVSERPDVALVNANLGLRGRETSVISALARHGIAVAVITDFPEEERWGEYLATGARIVIPKTQTLGAAVSVVRQLGRGERVLDLQERERLIALGNRRQAELRVTRGRLARLSVQEAVVLRHLMAGYGAAEIAETRSVSEATVRTQIKLILAKLEVRSQLAAVARATQAGWQPAPQLGLSAGATVPVRAPRRRSDPTARGTRAPSDVARSRTAAEQDLHHERHRREAAGHRREA